MVYILLAPGFEEAEALVPADLLRRAGLDVVLVGVEGALVPGGHQITVQTDCCLDQISLDQAEMVILPGGGVGVSKLGENSAVEALVRQTAARGIPLAAICAAPTLLGRWGLLKGRRAVCYPGMEDGLTEAQALREESVVRDGAFFTGRAAGSAFDFGLLLVEALAGPEKAREVQKAVVY
ncbi:MAG: DJ-1/PfpI family protein [Lawsonibacter sp.]|nr:DJ-1/PfpI family protein [Lawsonibacter sp.]